MSKIIKNIDTIDHTWVGQVILAGTSYQIQPAQELMWANDSSILVAITAGTAVVNNGTIDIKDINAAINWLKDIVTTQVDSDNASLSRIKQAPTGYTYILKAIDFSTSTAAGLYNFDTKGNDFGDVVISFKDVTGTVLTDPAAISANCVMTIVDFEPKFDYYLIGGSVKIIQTPTTDLRMWVIMAPDIPVSYGGSKALVCNVNFKFIQPNDKVDADGRAAKQLSYSATNHSNKMRFIFKHNAGAVSTLALFIEYYRA
jgi:hypothetical protein